MEPRSVTWRALALPISASFPLKEDPRPEWIRRPKTALLLALLYFRFEIFLANLSFKKTL